MIKIEQDALCDYCKDHHDSKMDNCEGSQCDKITEIYLDDLGISEDDPTDKVFKNLTVGAMLYLLEPKCVIPRIEKRIVSLISIIKDGSLRILHENEYLDLTPDEASTAIYQNYFLYKKDCQKKVEELCISRVVRLSKAIGALGSAEDVVCEKTKDA